MENIVFGTAKFAEQPVLHPVIAGRSKASGTGRNGAVKGEAGTAGPAKNQIAKEDDTAPKASTVKGIPESGGASDEEKKQGARGPADSAFREQAGVSKLRSTTAKFEYDEKIKRVTITISDRANGEVIKEIPPEDTRKMLERLHMMTGVFMNEEV